MDYHYFALARAAHVLAVVVWIGGVAFVTTVLIPADASLLSAVGLGRARVERFSERQVLRSLNETEPHLGEWFHALADEATKTLLLEGVEEKDIEIRRRLLYLRLLGQDASLEIEYAEDEPPADLFHRAYQSHYGYPGGSSPIEVESIRVAASSRLIDREESTELVRPYPVDPTGIRSSFLEGAWRDLDLFRRSDLSPGAQLEGPCLVLELHSATLVLEGWRGSIDPYDTLVLEVKDSSRGQTRD
jgi:N-methylhydantoinase A/oxoprolinase/acetone carboxylase beta subunit